MKNYKKYLLNERIKKKIINKKINTIKKNFECYCFFKIRLFLLLIIFK